jgi:hypothetical protein
MYYDSPKLLLPPHFSSGGLFLCEYSSRPPEQHMSAKFHFHSQAHNTVLNSLPILQPHPVYKFRIDQFGGIHCEITIKAMEG